MSTKAPVTTKEEKEKVKAEAAPAQAPAQAKQSKAQKIRELYLQGMNYYQVAKVLGVRPQYVRNCILNAVEAVSGHKDIKAEFARRQAQKKQQQEG